jgi:hypothetical protein
VILISVLIYFWQNTEPETSSISGSYAVSLSINPEDTNQTQVLLNIDGTTQIFGIIEDVYTYHYHPAEFVDGSLYIIRRFGDIETDDWSDQLWKYETADNGALLYEGKGLDFRVAPDGHVVAVFAGSSPDEVAILDPGGIAVQILLTKESLDLNSDYSLSYLSMANDGLWLSEAQGIQRMNVIGYDFDSGKINRWNISDAPIGIHESDFNPETLLLVYSDYQFAFDQDTEDGLKDTEVSLYVYDLNSGSKRLLVTSVKRHEFEPKWVSDYEIEFNALDGSGRDQISIE